MVDDLSKLLHIRLPKEAKIGWQTVYKNPFYKHGEESKIKGSFFPDEVKIFDAVKNVEKIKEKIKKIKSGEIKLSEEIVDDTLNNYNHDNSNDDICIKSKIFDFSENKEDKDKKKVQKIL